MKICPACQRCYEDGISSCSDKCEVGLVYIRPGARLIDNKYRLDYLLDRGGMGAVFRGMHVELNKPRAIKLLLPDFAKADPFGHLRLRREALTACCFDHRNVVRIYDFGTNVVLDENEDGSSYSYDELYIVMELLEGQSLKNYLKENKPLPLILVLEITIQIAEGLAEVHSQRVIHRDLKPGNIMLTRDRSGELVVKIVDFGAVKLTGQSSNSGDSDLTGTMFIGSALYTSPENCKNEPLDERSDIYSLGLILYEMLSGVPPFETHDWAELIWKHARVTPPHLAGVPESLARLVERSLQKDPASRPQSAGEFARELREIVASLVPKSPPPSAKTAPTAGAKQDSRPAPSDESDEEETRLYSAKRSGRSGRGKDAKRSARTPKVKTKGGGGTKATGASTDPSAGFAIAVLAVVLVALFSAMSILVLGRHIMLTPSAPVQEPSEQSNAPALDAAQPEAKVNSEVGDELLTVTDVNVRAEPGKGRLKVGLAEKDSRVRILEKHGNWRKVAILTHGREKEDPDTKDTGWIDGGTLQAIPD